jgi:hypothetical protein
MNWERWLRRGMTLVTALCLSLAPAAIPVTAQGELPVGRVRSIKAPIGAGGAPIRVATTNGPLSIEKR